MRRESGETISGGLSGGNLSNEKGSPKNRKIFWGRDPSQMGRAEWRETIFPGFPGKSTNTDGAPKKTKDFLGKR